VPDPMEILNRLRAMQVRVEELRRESDLVAERRREAYRDAAAKLISTQNVINSVRARLHEKGDRSVCGSSVFGPHRPTRARDDQPCFNSFFFGPHFLRFTCVLSSGSSRDWGTCTGRVQCGCSQPRPFQRSLHASAAVSARIRL
jgi:hypothetical protein